MGEYIAEREALKAAETKRRASEGDIEKTLRRRCLIPCGQSYLGNVHVIRFCVLGRAGWPDIVGVGRFRCQCEAWRIRALQHVRLFEGGQPGSLQVPGRIALCSPSIQKENKAHYTFTALLMSSLMITQGRMHAYVYVACGHMRGHIYRSGSTRAVAHAYATVHRPFG